jgi:tripartite-type tricarboxylate transporter receptor subunit TctC
MELSLMKSVASRALLAAAMLTSACSLAAADEYPSRIIKLVVAAPAGGGIDIVARLIERVMSQQLGQKIIVDNRPGANGFLGAAFVAGSPPDGYTIFTTVSAPVTNPLNAPISYDVETAFQPISRVMASPFFLVVPESSKIKSVGELIAAGKDPNQTIRYGHPGVGTVTYMATVLFNQMAGAKFVDIPYRGSAGQVTDTLSGELQFGLLAAPDALSRRNEGLRILGVSSAKRSILAPDIPTIAEAGVPGYDFELWHGLFAPAKTPRPVIDRIRSALAAALEDQETRARFLTLGMVPALDTPEEFAALVRNQRAKDSALAKELNLKPQ